MSSRFRQCLFCYGTLLAPQALARVAGHLAMSPGIIARGGAGPYLERLARCGRAPS